MDTLDTSNNRDASVTNNSPVTNNTPIANNISSQTHSSNKNINYISIGMKRFKELSLPVLNLLNSLNPSQHRMAIIVVGIIFFWPLLILVLNLPWILAAGFISYGFYFGSNKLYSDANEAAKDHLSVDFEEKGRQVQLKFQESNFFGKETLISYSNRLKEFSIITYKSLLLASMTLLDFLVTTLLNLARSAKKCASAADRNGADAKQE